MSDKPEKIPMLILKGRTMLRREYSSAALSDLSKSLRKRGFEKLYIVDNDGLERNRPQLDIVQSLSNDFSIIYDAGPRRGASVIDFVTAGSDIVVVSTSALESFKDIHIALSYTDALCLRIVWKTKVVWNPDLEKSTDLATVIGEVSELGMKDFVVRQDIAAETSKILAGKGAVLRVIADSGTASIENADFVIVDHETIDAEEKKE